jgi:hypothetical protein
VLRSGPGCALVLHRTAEAKLVPPERKWLRAIIHEGDAEAVVKEKKEKALAEHVARHPEDVGLTVEDFNWIVRIIVRPAA